MNKVFNIASAAAAFFVCCTPNFAANLFLGNYTAVCGTQPDSGISIAETRNISTLGVRQQTVHLQAQDSSVAEAFVHNDAGSRNIDTVVNSPIQFTLQRGNANFLKVVVIYTPPGATSSRGAIWYSPTTRLDTSAGGANFMSNVGNVYGINIPSGSTLNVMYFVQCANQNNCNSQSSDINQLAINAAFVGIDTTESSTCGTSCSGL